MTTSPDPFVSAYLECALWLATDGERGEIQLDTLYSVDDFTAEAIHQATDDCQDFRITQADDLTDIDDEQGGHDFWLTRNGHGAGFLGSRAWRSG